MATKQERRQRAREDREARERAAAAAERRRKRRGYALGGLLAVAVAAVVVAAVVAGGGGGGGGEGTPGAAEAGHVHGLGVNPRDGSLFIATHSGLFRAAPADTTPARVGQSDQDIMGFTVAGTDRFLGSGHPGSGQDLPPLLGLIESRDGGRSWTPVSLLGEADFHVLRAAGDRVYGFDSANGRFMASADGGRAWQQREVPAALLDLAIDPRDSDHLVGAGESGLLASADAGRSWRPLGGDRVGLLAWSDAGLFMLDAEGGVSVSRDAGRRFEDVGRVGGQPVAFMAAGTDLYVALADGSVQRSTDGGRSWTARARL